MEGGGEGGERGGGESNCEMQLLEKKDKGENGRRERNKKAVFESETVCFVSGTACNKFRIRNPD